MSPRQLQLIHAARRQLNLEDSDYRTILRSIGHVESSKDLSNQSFEQVMGFLEARGFGGPGAHYWQDKAASQGVLADARQIHLIEQLAVQVPHYKLGGLVMRFSQDRTDKPEQLKPREAYNLIECLKSIIARNNQAAAGSQQSPSARVEVSPATATTTAEMTLFGSVPAGGFDSRRPRSRKSRSSVDPVMRQAPARPARPAPAVIIPPDEEDIPF
jgi:hypothetical protein